MGGGGGGVSKKDRSIYSRGERGGKEILHGPKELNTIERNKHKESKNPKHSYTSRKKSSQDRRRKADE